MTPRTARFFRNNSCYHLVTRGHQQQRLFAEDSDYRFYLSLIKKYKQRFQMRVYGFCLMPDHVHLIAKAVLPRHLSAFMQGINQSYALYFNAQHQRIGRLWRGRFKSILLPTEYDVMNCLQYVEYAPVRLQITGSPSSYPWGSCLGRIMGDPAGVLDTFFYVGNVLQVPEMSVSPPPR